MTSQHRSHERRKRRRKRRKRKKKNECPSCGEPQHDKVRSRTYFDNEVTSNKVELKARLYRNIDGELVAEGKAKHIKQETNIVRRELFSEQEPTILLFSSKPDPQKMLENQVTDAITELYEEVNEVEELEQVEMSDNEMEELIGELFTEDGETR